MMNLYVAICLLAVAATADADGALGLEGLGVPVYAPGHASVDYYAYPRYAFEYSVKDPHTGDNKAQWEKRDGDVVKGAYSLVEPDGSLRVVEYWADDKSGFNAVVKRLGPNLHPASIQAAPIYKAPIPILGHGSNFAPITVGPVANLGHLASAPLISGPIHGPALSSQNSINDAVIVKSVLPVVKTPILSEAIFHEPLLRRPILREPVLQQPIIKGPILSDLIYKNVPIGPNVPIPGPIYKAGPIYSEPLGPLPNYKAPLAPYKEIYPIQKTQLPALSLLKGQPLPPYLLAIQKGVLPSLQAPLSPYQEVSPINRPLQLASSPLPPYQVVSPYSRGPLSAGPGPLSPYEEILPDRKQQLPILPLLKGQLELGRLSQSEGYGKRPISSLDWESLGLKGQLVEGIGPYGPGLLKGNIGPIEYESLARGPLQPSWNGPAEYPLYNSGEYKH